MVMPVQRGGGGSLDYTELHVGDGARAAGGREFPEKYIGKGIIFLDYA